jgi:hypothetical protein
MRSSRVRLILVASLGVLIGAAAGIGGAMASSGATTNKSPTTSTARSPWPGAPPGLSQRMSQAAGRLSQLRGQVQALGIAGAPVHMEMVVPKTGGGFENVTVDHGTVNSVSGNTLVINESYNGQSYKTVTLTIPSNATVDRNLSSASLSDLKAGDHVAVISSDTGTHVSAFDSQHAPTFHGPGMGKGSMPGGPAAGGFMFGAGHP